MLGGAVGERGRSARFGGASLIRGPGLSVRGTFDRTSGWGGLDTGSNGAESRDFRTSGRSRGYLFHIGNGKR